MKRIVANACCIALLFVTGCKMVTTTEPIGSIAPRAELMPLQGNWINDDGETFEIRVTRSGKLLVCGVEWDEEREEFRAKTIEFIATNCGDLKLLQMQFDDASPYDGYAFCRYQMEGDQAQLYFPIMSVFEDAIASKKLSGSIRAQQYLTDVHLESTGNSLVSFLAESGKNSCFEPEPGATFERLRRIE